MPLCFPQVAWPSHQQGLPQAAGPSSPEAQPWGCGDTPSFPEETCCPRAGISISEIPQLVEGSPGQQEAGPGVTDQVPTGLWALGQVPTMVQSADGKRTGM